MEQHDLNLRTAVLETNEKNIFHQLDEIKEQLKELNHLTRLCELISAKLSASQEKLSGVEGRLRRLEEAPGEDLRHYRRSAVAYLITGALGVLLGLLGVCLK